MKILSHVAKLRRGCRSRAFFLALPLLLPGLGLHAVVVTEEVAAKNTYLEVALEPGEGGALHTFSLLSRLGNLAGQAGLLQEGFGVGSFYAPNRRLNEKFEILEDYADRPVFRYSYDCDGLNIAGLRVVRRMELLPGTASFRVRWTVTNGAETRQWLAPWLCNALQPGGQVDERDRYEAPTLAGIQRLTQAAYYPMARNWLAATDPVEEETAYVVFNAEHLHSARLLWDEDSGARGFQAAFAPRFLEPGESWTTQYRVNAVRGLSHVNFATDELAAQIDYSAGMLTVLLAGVQAMENMRLQGRVVASDGRLWTLPDKQFSLQPGRLARCTYDWAPPEKGSFEFLGQLRQQEKTLPLGRDTASPHGGIDAQFLAGVEVAAPWPAWTDAPHTLERGPRDLKRSLAAVAPHSMWFESGLQKIFHQDRVEPEGLIDPTVRVQLARNEYESFQLVLRPEADLERVQVQWGALRHAESGTTIDGSQLRAYTVNYHAVKVPSHFEGATGAWPDALTPLTPFRAPAGQATPLWFTLRAPTGIPAGVYRGRIEVYVSGADPVELTVEATVFDFDLPERPALKTDFGFLVDAVKTDPALYLSNALEHGVTLRELTALPPERADYANALSAYARRMQKLGVNRASTIFVPPSLADAPAQRGQAQDFVAQAPWAGRAFSQIANEPERPAWPRILEEIQQWKDRTPDIPLMVTTYGLRPFLSEAVDIWTVHLPVFDTPQNKVLLERIDKGGEVWVYVDQFPARPYANFFLDFSALEHRMLFWQLSALGVKGLHYWCVNYSVPGQDPWRGVLDITPVNGDGLLVYPGPEGPVNSIRWEVIRDGIEDYGYLALLQDARKKLQATGGPAELLKTVNLDTITTSLVTFTRTPATLLEKRLEIAQTITAIQRALKSSP
jgi:hypothetical protein